LVSEINELAWDKESGSKGGTIEFAFSDEQTEKVIHFEKIKEKLKKSLFNQIIDNLSDPWETHYKELAEYFKTNNTNKIQARYKTKTGFGLGTWAVSQRRGNKKT
jgi:hypothetical protein